MMSAVRGNWGRQYAARVATAAEQTPSLQREWWLRTLAIFQAPRTVFAALRDDSREAADARQEPVLAIVILAGIASVLSTSLAGHVLDESGYDGLAVGVWAFLGGALQGFLILWLGGLLLLFGARALGGASTYRQVRHIVGFAAAPVALSLLLLWPVRLAVYGGDLFRAGGDDSGAGDKIFEGLVLAAFAWMLALVVIGVRTLHDWSWARTLGAVALAGVLPALIVLVSSV